MKCLDNYLPHFSPLWWRCQEPLTHTNTDLCNLKCLGVRALPLTYLTDATTDKRYGTSRLNGSQPHCRGVDMRTYLQIYCSSTRTASMSRFSPTLSALDSLPSNLYSRLTTRSRPQMDVCRSGNGTRLGHWAWIYLFKHFAMTVGSRFSNSSSMSLLNLARRSSKISFSLEESTLSILRTYRRFCRPNSLVSALPRTLLLLLLTNDTSDFGLGLRPPTFYPLMGSGIFTQDGRHWRHSRELLRPQFMTNRFTNFEHIRCAVDNLIFTIPDDKDVDLQPLFFRLTFETTLFVLFGQHLPSLQSEGITGQESDFANAFNLGQEYLAKRGRLGDFYWLLDGRKFRKACKICHEFVDCAVQKALGSATNKTPGTKTETYVFIEALIEETRNPEVLRDQCLNILLAGRDTTACCLTWTLRLLVQHPHVLSKLRAEISDRVGIGLGSPTPTITQVRSLPYLSLVIKEVLRLYPSVPVNSRAATKTTTLPTGGGPTGTAPILVRKGEAVGYCVYAMHRRRDIYGADADKFRPERWDNDALKDVGWGYLPFNGGPRVCLGQEFALLEVGYTIVRLLQTFEVIEQAEGCRMEKGVGDERQVLTLVVSCGEGCVVQMRRYGEV
ncbi:cytochrome P450 [Aspergillus niger CBS 101883]|uniref:cytochrome P450 n=1 Tax=Aspergillus lacticoffeatus (strain CBS 101883) TaxID=1450533 RepID=UPI000D7F70F0|nr:cytochrome P450 [Aspergillus niger CBS 101883]PYH57086.1 cytochrome P450 [Aspergillus niger CBS 101883]